MSAHSRRADQWKRAPMLRVPEPGPYDRIKAAILSGDFQPGQILVEAALAEWCDVSRTPVREALGRLQQDGLVVRGDRGVAVKDISPEEILDIYETRIALEATAARVASERRSAHDLIAMRRHLAKMASRDVSTPSEMASANGEFHATIWRASRNESLIELLGRLSMHLGRYPATTLAFPGRWSAAAEEHGELVSAIDARDGVRAAEVAAAHFSAARDIRLKLWESG